MVKTFGLFIPVHEAFKGRQLLETLLIQHLEFTVGSQILHWWVEYHPSSCKVPLKSAPGTNYATNIFVLFTKLVRLKLLRL